MNSTTVTINIAGTLDLTDAASILNQIKTILNNNNPRVVSFGTTPISGSEGLGYSMAGPYAYAVSLPVNMTVTIDV